MSPVQAAWTFDGVVTVMELMQTPSEPPAATEMYVGSPCVERGRIL